MREEKKKKRGRVPFFSSIQMKYAMSYLAIVSVVLILLNTYPVLASQDLLFRSKRDSLKSQAAVMASALMELETLSLLTADAVPEVLNFSTNCVNSQTFIEYLSGRHIYISGGSACDKGEPSHTLMAMGAPDLAVRTALRVSFCGDNTPEDVQALLDGLKDGLKELQHI